MLNLPILPVRQDQEDGLAEAIENGERPEAKQEGVLSQRRLALTKPCGCRRYLAKNPDGYCGLKGTGVSCPHGGNLVIPAH